MFRKSICLVKELFTVNPFKGISWETLRQVSQQLPRKIPLTFGIFSVILSICCCNLIVYYLPKSLWNRVSVSQICCWGCCTLFLSFSVWPNIYRILICRFHIRIFVGAVWKVILVLWCNILEPAEVIHVIFRL